MGQVRLAARGEISRNVAGASRRKARPALQVSRALLTRLVRCGRRGCKMRVLACISGRFMGRPRWSLPRPRRAAPHALRRHRVRIRGADRLLRALHGRIGRRPPAGQIDMACRQLGIGAEDPLNRQPLLGRGSDVVHRDPGAADDWRAGQDLRIPHDQVAQIIPLVHTTLPRRDGESVAREIRAEPHHRPGSGSRRRPAVTARRAPG